MTTSTASTPAFHSAPVPPLDRILIENMGHSGTPEDMAAFDELPPELRRTLRDAVVPHSALAVRYALRCGYTGAAVREMVDRIDRHFMLRAE